MSRIAALLACAALATLALASAAQAEFGIVPGSTIAKAHEPIPLLQVHCRPGEKVAGVGCRPGQERIADLPAIRAAAPLSQAGAHPDATGAGELTDTEHFNARDFFVKTPPGFLGNITAVPACSRVAFNEFLHESLYESPVAGCAPASQVGVATIWFNSVIGSKTRETSPVYRLTAARGYPASFGFSAKGIGIVVNGDVRTDGDYGVTVGSTGITTFITFEASAVTLWGDPGDSIHDPERWDPARSWVTEGGKTEYGDWGFSPGLQRIPLLQTPTDCNAQGLLSTVSIDSWQEPGRFLPEDPFNPLYAIPAPTPTGCEKLSFKPWIALEPWITNSDSPTGVSVQMEVPQNQDPEGLSTPQLKRAVVTLPEGMSVNPAAADGLQGCSSAQIALMTTHGGYPNPIRFEEGEAHCPQASKIGSVELQTPLLEETLEGSVYLAAPYDNPFGSLYAIYIVVNGPGFTVKLPGKVEPNPVTGQLTTTFEYLPQLPFENLKLNFFGGPRGPLATPATCGVKTITTELTPWSAPQSGPPATPFNRYTATAGPAGAPCAATPAARPFAPGLLAGTQNPVAGHTSAFNLRLQRPDGDQELADLTVRTPPGLTAYIKGVPYCSEQAIAVAATRSGEYEAAHPDCPAASEVGHLLSGVGAGPSPLFIEGNVYLAGPYKGAPLSLVTITPALAGGSPGHPLFDLGTVVVRVAVYIDPKTAAITAVSDPIPQILDGIPLRVKDVRVILDRPDWISNPTSCEPMAVTAQAAGQSGATASLSNRFQVSDCAALAFRPLFQASTSGKTSKANGASLTVKLTYPNAPQGTQANIAKVKVDLPKQLPSRLTTLQKACTAAQFDANPAGCPAASVIGHAKAVTPILPVTLEGPAYFVSHGGEAFPSLIMVLQGYGITIDLVGTTFISKAGITSSTFATVPDQPLTSFELTLPQGKFSALAANGNLCKSKLAMPTAFVAQNGLEIHESTPIGVIGCPPTRAKASTRAQKLAAALKACKKQPKGKRAACGAKARKQYGPVTNTKQGAKKKK